MGTCSSKGPSEGATLALTALYAVWAIYLGYYFTKYLWKYRRTTGIIDKWPLYLTIGQFMATITRCALSCAYVCYHIELPA